MATIRGSKKWEAKMRRAANGLVVTDILLAGAERTRKEYVESINKITGVKRETRYDPHRVVTVSSPGTPPNSDLGDLVNSTGVVSERKNQAEAFVSSDHAAPLEFGTSRMAPRPALAPAFERTKGWVLQKIRERVRGVLNR